MKKIILLAIIGLSFYPGLQQSVHAESGPVAYWDFSEGSGSTVHDKIGLNDGTIYGATWVDNALSFNGLNNYVKIPDNSALNPTSAITISMWIKPSVLGGIALNKELQYRLIAGDVSSTKPSARIRTTNTNWVGIEGTSILTVNNWQHVALTYDGSSWKIYYNGQLDTEIADSGTIAPPYSDDGNLYLGDIGPNRGQNFFYKGLIDDVKIYNRALSASEIAADSSHRTSTPVCDPQRYSTWSSCSPDGNQTRNIISSTPNTCTTNSILQQSCVFIPPTCTSWTYSDWSSCSANGGQTRSVVSSSPSSCTGGSPVINQSCTYTPPIPSCIATNWSCSSWGVCSQNGSQARTCDKNINCQGGVSSPAISQSCAYVAPVPSCTSFNYSGWSECSSNGSQTRNVTSKYPYNCENGESPKTTQSCTYTPSCTADTWTCGTWGTCSLSGIQNRSCTKTFDCPNVQTAPPVTDQYCEAPSRPVQQVPQDSSDVISNQDTIIKATVKLYCLYENGAGVQGSGTVIDSGGTILTNKHVVDQTLGCFVEFIDNFNDTPNYDVRQIADIQKVSSNEDVAILKLRNPQNKKLTYIDITKANSNFRLGTKVNIYGYPAIFGTNMTYTSGDFSGVDGSYLKTTAILEHGNSGGGAYLSNGMFIGIPSSVRKGELNALGYILSINTINAWLGNSSFAYNNNSSNNNYSRVSSILETIDLKTLGSLRQVIPGTKESKEIIKGVTQSSPAAPPSIIKESTSSQMQKETSNTEVESSIQNNNSVPAQSESQPRPSLVKRFISWITHWFK